MIGNSQVIIVTLVSWWLFGERPNRFILLSLPMVIGLLLISGIWDDDVGFGDDPVGSCRRDGSSSILFLLLNCLSPIE